VLLVLAACAVLPALAGEPPRRTKLSLARRQLEIDGRTILYYEARPRGEGTWPAVILAHDSMGVDKEFTAVADRLAAEGFLVLAPDLYRGRMAQDADKGRELAILLDTHEAFAIISALAAHLKFLPEVGDHRVGLVGLGIGGHVALEGGGASTDLSAVVTACARPTTNVEDLRRIGVPILAVYGEKDEAVTQQEIEAFRSALSLSGRTATVTAYPGEGRDLMKAPVEGQQDAAAGQAWAAMIAFLRSHL
jgi:carboxymethylenebutenolidase